MSLEKYEDFLEISVKEFVTQSNPIFVGNNVVSSKVS